MSTLNLRWVDSGPAAGPRSGVPPDVLDSVTIIVGVSRTIEHKWAELSDADRKDLATMLRRRADLLVASLSQHGLLQL